MNKLVIPPPPNWYETNVISCAPDNTIIYGSRNDVIIIYPSPEDEPSDVKILNRCHQDRVISTAVSPNWNQPDKLAVSLGDDKVVSLIDVAKGELKKNHSGHRTRSEKVVGVTFCGYDKIISVSEDGFIIIWKWATNELKSLTDFLSPRVKVSCLLACPHVSYIVAFGLRRGGIVVADLRRSGRILHNIRAHNHSVLSLAWCPVPYNIFPEKTIVRRMKDAKQGEILPINQANITEELASTPKYDVNTVIDFEKTIDDTTFIVSVNGNYSSPEETVKNTIEDSVNSTIEEAVSVTATITECEANDVKQERIEDDNDGKQTDKCEDDNQFEQINKVNDAFPKETVEGKNSAIEQNDNSACIKTDVEQEVSGPKLITEKSAESPVLEDKTIRNGEVASISTNSHESEGRSLEELHDFVIVAQPQTEICDSPTNNTQADIKIDFSQNKTPVKEYLLASCAKGGREIMIWRALTDGVKHVQLNCPYNRNNKNRQFSEEKSWIALCWVAPEILLSSSLKGELVSWDLNNSTAKGNFRCRLIHDDHFKNIFSIAAPIKIYKSFEEVNVNDAMLNAWTIGKDRLVLNTNLSTERKPLALYPTTAGSVYCISSSPTYPNRIALGGGEGTLRIWDLSRPHSHYIIMNEFHDKQQEKITCLAWHPTKDTLLAYGTGDGRIGILDPCSRKPVLFLVQYYSSSIYKLEWGPCKGDQQNYILYAVASGKLLAYDTDKLLAAPTVVDVGENISHMAWKPDFSVCILSNKSGQVQLYSKELNLISTFYIQHKSARCMAWHPQSTAADDDLSPQADWLAVGTQDVTVYNCVWSPDAKDQLDISERMVAVLKGHVRSIECMSWSSFESGKLASASSDGTVMVWDVKQKILIHTCRLYNGDSFLSVLWSPLDPDYVLTGSKGCIVQIWKLSENPPLDKPLQKTPKTKRAKNKMFPPLADLDLSETTSTFTNENGDEDITEIDKPIKTCTRKYVLGGLIEAHNRNLHPMLFEDCKRLYTLGYGNDKKLGEVEENINGMPRENVHIDPIKIFGDQQDVQDVLRIEGRYHSKKSTSRNRTHISLWQGSMDQTIKNAIQTKTMNDWLINLAPHVSMELYLEACEAYAQQLSEEANADTYKVVSYYLVCHKLDKAIETLCASKNYCEALVLAKCRMVSNDPRINKIIERWAAYSEYVGCYEIAAQCYIVLKRIEDAVKILSRRTDAKSLKFCSELAKHCDNKELSNSIAFRLLSLGEEAKVFDDEVPLKPLLTRVELEMQKECGSGDDSIKHNGALASLDGESNLKDDKSNANDGEISSEESDDSDTHVGK